jgi:hypothetical protein
MNEAPPPLFVLIVVGAVSPVLAVDTLQVTTPDPVASDDDK